MRRGDQVGAGGGAVAKDDVNDAGGDANFLDERGQNCGFVNRGLTDRDVGTVAYGMRICLLPRSV